MGWLNQEHNHRLLEKKYDNNSSLFNKNPISNNTMELCAIHEALKIMIEKKCDNIVIYTDSLYSLRAINNNMVGTTKQHSQLIADICRLKAKICVHILYIPGHSNLFGNMQAHDLAFNAASDE